MDAFDDDGDGVADRKVHQILFDYQGLPEGGQAFLRLMHFDNEGQTITSRTYSPYLDQFNSTDPSLEVQHQEFTMDYADFNLAPQTKSLGTDSFTAEILTSHTIASFADVASGTTLTATWDFKGMFTSSRHIPGVNFAGLIHPGLGARSEAGLLVAGLGIEHFIDLLQDAKDEQEIGRASCRERV